ncbi:AraC family transcriptional regulator [Nonomuraea mangrovi]|uniref:AraC family transcriptional regulator n=1 Tax=Nonomuraea mangrovi TaxID=2316207 RepID=A0ABW4TGI0_9ACTN
MEDALSSLLHEVTPRGALFDQSIVRPPWALRFVEETPLTLMAILSGEAWIVPDGGDPVLLRARDVAIVRGPEPFTVADSPGTAPLAVIHDAELCTTPDGRTVLDELPMCADDGLGRSAIGLKGTYQVRGSVTERVLSALPRVAHVPSASAGRPILDMIVSEIGRDKPGQQVVLDRLLDLLLVSSLREWFDRPEACAPSWYRAHHDPVIGRALRLIHDDPAHPWTVASLAGKAGVSRSRFAQRFTELVGRPPMAYLTDWRICQAADLLARTDGTVDAVARQVGYSNAYALSVAFKRTLGVRPSEHRARSRLPA